MPIIIAGIDEAGYGPLLGPLSVGMTVFRLDDWSPGDPAPNLWKLLAGGVCRKPADKRRRIAVDDSKKLKRPNDSDTCHPLAHLERGVLAFLACLPPPFADAPPALPLTDLALFESLNASLEPHPWYAGDPLPVPVSTSAAEIAIAANVLRTSLARAGIGILGMHCHAIGEAAFNEIVARSGTKAAATGQAITRFLRLLWDHHTVDDPACPGGPRLVCDRQGGRTRYADSLGAALPGASVAALEEAPERSRYLIQGACSRIPGDDRPRTMTVTFMPESESRHLPVALASMLAKLVRELAMARFNRYWNSLMPELKPTAGYTQDGRRWLVDAAPVLSGPVRATLVRRA